MEKKSRQLHFVKMDPSGNTTILVLNSLPRKEYPWIAARLMEDRCLCAEQVGYVEATQTPGSAGRLHMMGGEFCGNAARSFAAYLALREETGDEIPIEISGHDGILTAKVKRGEGEASCDAAVEMPLPQNILHGATAFFGRYSLVIFEGISHMILWEKEPFEEAVGQTEKFLQEAGLDTECFGVLFFREETEEMIPVVTVKSVESVVWESSCGSGTVAAACAMADLQKVSILRKEIRQPGGSLFISIERRGDGTLCRAILSGKVLEVAEGTVYL